MNSTQERQSRREQHPHGEYLSAYVDHRLDVARMRDIGLHLGHCGECTQQVVALEGMRTRLHEMPVPPADPQFWANAYRRLRVEQLARTPRPFQRRRAAAPAGRWAAGVAAAAVAAGLLLAPQMQMPSSQSSAQVRPVRVIAAPAQDVSPDVAALVASHTDSVSCLPLADVDRQKMIAADARQGTDKPDTADTADGSF